MAGSCSSELWVKAICVRVHEMFAAENLGQWALSCTIRNWSDICKSNTILVNLLVKSYQYLIKLLIVQDKARWFTIYFLLQFIVFGYQPYERSYFDITKCDN